MVDDRLEGSDALNERMNAVLDLLVAAGTDTVDNSMLERQEGRCRLDFAKSIPLPEDPQPFDKNVEKLTQDLHDCRQETPERQKVDDLDPSEPRQLTSYSNHGGGARRASKVPKEPKAPKEPRQQQESAAMPVPVPVSAPAPPKETGEVDRRSALERELSETSYPKIGPGYSDSISVVSDLTTPTVVTGVHIPEEEFYQKGPPMQIGVTTTSKPRKERDRVSANRRSSRSMKPNHIQQQPRKVQQREMVAPSTSTQQQPRQERHTLSPQQPQQQMPAPPTPMQQQQLRRSGIEAKVPVSAPQTIPQSPLQRRRTGGAAAQRRQSHMAVLAQLKQTQPVPSHPMPKSPSAAARSRSVQPAHASMPTAETARHQRVRSLQPSVPKSVNDFPSLNSNTDQFENDTSYGSEGYGRPKTSSGGKRRSLLRMSNKYAPSVSTASSRMLLNSSQAKTSKNRPYGLMRRRGTDDTKSSKGRNNPGTVSTESTSRGYGSLPSSGSNNIDLDGVLSTMGKDIDYIFRELNALEESSPDAPPSSPTRRMKSADMRVLPASESGVHTVNESNLGSTAKIKYTLGSVGRTLRTDEDIDKSTANSANGMERSGVELNVPISDPLLIDEDGFIIAEETGVSDDPFSAGKGDGTPKKKDAFHSVFTPGPSANRRERKAGVGVGRRNTMNVASSSHPESRAAAQERRRSSMTHTARLQTPQTDPANKEVRIDAVELATKKRIEMLRKLVHQRSERFPMDDPSLRRGEDALNNKLDFVEAETMKQIARLRTRLGESQRGGLARA